MSAAAGADTAWAAWVQAEVSTWPRLGEQQRAALRVLLDLRAAPQDVLAVRVPSPAALSEGDRSVTVSIRAATSPAPPITSHSEAIQP